MARRPLVPGRIHGLQMDQHTAYVARSKNYACDTSVSFQTQTRQFSAPPFRLEPAQVAGQWANVPVYSIRGALEHCSQSWYILRFAQPKRGRANGLHYRLDSYLPR